MSFVAVVHDDHLTFNGVEYYRDGAGSVLLGAYGIKKTPAPRSEHVAVQGRLPAGKLAVRSSTAVTVDAAGMYAGGGLYGLLKDGARKLVRLEMLLPDVKVAVNGSPPALRDLKSYGWEARIVHQVIAILEPALADALARATTFRFSGDEGTGELVAHVGGTAVALPSESTFAYLLCRPDWNRSRTGVERFVDEPWGVE